MVEETIQRCREHSKGCPRAEGEDPQLGIRPHWRKWRAEKSAGLPDPELAYRRRASRYQPPRIAVSKLGAGRWTLLEVRDLEWAVFKSPGPGQGGHQAQGRLCTGTH